MNPDFDFRQQLIIQANPACSYDRRVGLASFDFARA